ncbi:unnamed protein product [Cladocopium goreaui]|uniref:Transmembrane protein n=1 Tax=Cladocopium goreaui TaxID=2562237 RepID=A0A9P1DAR5_9DINO|nr:unnamed protein product [Cladocopium goreaui]
MSHLQAVGILLICCAEIVAGTSLRPYSALRLATESLKADVKPMSLLQSQHQWKGEVQDTTTLDFLDEYLSLTKTDPPSPKVPNSRAHSRRMRLEKALLFMLVPLIPAGGLLMLYNMAANASARPMPVPRPAPAAVDPIQTVQRQEPPTTVTVKE